ncbi:homoserine kinase [Novosphingobium sp. Chol11]|uniref:homoserine kinase n=1 Tax=Novosphingobium sp. Chol11 TaxID=1385763 RepID=UPI002600695E|nr:homoserine kinase [Novosphingobium sp. Chol11]
MAVYTHLGAEEMAALLAEFDVGTLISAKGIAEGVSNSNWLLETTGPEGAGPTRYILTMYEFRIELADLPFFLSLLDHLAEKGCPVPRTIHDRDGRLFRMRGDKALALIEFLPGVSVSTPSPAQAHAVGAELARMHLASSDFGTVRANGMALAEWQRLAAACGEAGLSSIDPALAEMVARELPRLAAQWPTGLPSAVIHADLFPDNALVLGERISGLIDFYFACNDLCAYDLAITHLAWCFDEASGAFRPELSRAMIDGYETLRPLAPDERAAMPLLAQGAAMRFIMSRAYDWLNTPADALVTRRDPMQIARRMTFYQDNPGIFA